MPPLRKHSLCFGFRGSSMSGFNFLHFPTWLACVAMHSIHRFDLCRQVPKEKNKLAMSHVWCRSPFRGFPPSRFGRLRLRAISVITLFDFRGFDSSIILIVMGGILMSILGKFESSNLSRDNVSREIGRTPQHPLLTRSCRILATVWHR